MWSPPRQSSLLSLVWVRTPPAPSGKVINLSDIQAADKGSKEASAPAQNRKAPEADKPPKRRGRPPKEQAGPTTEKKSKAAEPRTGRPSKVDKVARDEGSALCSGQSVQR